MQLDLIEKLQRDQHPNDESRTRRASELRSLYETLAVHLFDQYEPTKRASRRVSRDFMVRLNTWLECFSNSEERWAAFRSIEYLFFSGQDEFEELYRFSLENIVKPWLVDIIGLDIFEKNAKDILDRELESLWPCPVTDSLRINSFLHVTGLSGHGLRPDWYSLRKLGSCTKIEEYRVNNNIKYLLLLEDFSGSGGQIARTLKFAAKTFNGPILVIPLLICAPGDRLIKSTIAELDSTKIYYQPASVINDSCLIKKSKQEGEPKLFSTLRNAMKSGHAAMSEDIDTGEYGWKDVGSLVVLYSNCPNNTPPIYHHSCSTWSPIFPRSNRELRP